jgi:Protein of unknown function (DUF3465)
LVLENKKTTSTVVTATVLSLALLGLVKVTSLREPPAEPSATAPEFAPQPIAPLAQEGDGGAALIDSAFQARNSGQVVQLRGVVRNVLPDERQAPRRQRLTLELSGGRTLLVTHDVEASARVPAAVGDVIELCGRYEWNNRGGLVSGTHTSPDDERARGWIRHAGTDYR